MAGARIIPIICIAPHNVYLADQDDSGTDTDTSSDYGEDTDTDGWAPNPALPANEQAAELYWAYARAKARWRSFMGKPTRKARRFARRAFRSGKGWKSKYGKCKGKITSTPAYLSELNEPQLMELFPAFTANGGKKGIGSGKGKGRKGNGSEEHLVTRCPRRSQNPHQAAAGSSRNILFVDLDTH